jgi:hypothetical protein
VTDGTSPPAAVIGVDARPEVAQRSREVLWTAVGTMLPYGVGVAMLCLEPWTWSAEGWLGATAFLLTLLGTGVWQFGTVRGRAGQAWRLLSEYAVLRHIDPGVGRREPADRTARTFARGRFFSWLYVLLLLGVPAVVIGKQGDRPGWAVAGLVLLGIAGVVQLLTGEREARAGRRWLADPPGPPRD